MKTLSIFTLSLMLIIAQVTIYASNGNEPVRSKADVSTFIENKGQWPEEVLYLTKLNGLNAWITTSGVTYDHFTIIRQKNPDEFRTLPPHEREQAERENISIKGHVVRITLENARRTVQASGQDCQTSYHNYFIGNDPAKWASNVQLYGEIELNGVYDGISVKYYIDQGQLRYDYHLAPGADAGQIRIKPEGTDGWHINPAGELLIETSLGTVCHGKIFAYQLTNGVKAEVECSFQQLPDGSLGLHTGNYDLSKPLVIDPIVFSTYLGGSGMEHTPTMVLAQNGSLVIAGNTGSANFPITVGSYQITNSGANDITISKLNPAATTLEFSTYLGGINSEYRPDITVGQDGSIFIAGSTESTDFPVTEGSFQTTNPGGITGFVTKLNSNGTSLIYSTYLGGNDTDEINAFMVDPTGNAYLTGFTYSLDFPTTPGTINYEYGYLFVVKLNASANELIYSTIFSSGIGYDIAIDNVGNAYITGSVGVYHPITPGAFQTQNPGSTSAFATVINPLATEVLYSTYLGGNIIDWGVTICIAQNDDIVVGGWTQSTDFPTTAESFQPNFVGDIDGFVIRLNSSLTQMVWGTFLGGVTWDEVSNIALDEYDNVAVTGFTFSVEDFPVTTNLIGNTTGYYLAAFVSLISNNGYELIYSAIIANNSFYETHGSDILFKNYGNIVIAGTTGDLFPITPGTYQQNFGGGSADYFIMEILPVNCQTTCSATVLNHVSCRNGSDGQAQANPSGGIEPYSYLWSNGQTTQIATGLSAGNYTVEVSDLIGCTAETSVTITQPTLLVLASLQTWPASCATSPDGSALAQASGGTPPYTYLWSNGETGNQATALLPGSNSLTIIDNNACEKITSFEISYIQPFNEEEICAVTLNTETNKNLVVWEKTEGVRTIAYNIYRESSTGGIYEFIGSTGFNESPIYEDLTANPAQQSYRYKLSVVDSCQEESDLSDFHKSIHLTSNMGINGEVNLLWSPYEGFTYPTHFIMRSVNGGAFQLIGQLPASNFSFTDLAPPAGLKKYMIEIDAPGSCGLRDSFRVHSNAVIVTETGLNEAAGNTTYLIKPNPGDGHFLIETPPTTMNLNFTVMVYNSQGRLVLTKETQPSETGISIDIMDQPDGIYLVKLYNTLGESFYKIAKQ
jgi:hypothetical protein